MIMNRFLIIIAYLFLCVEMHAQKSLHHVQGYVLDYSTGENLDHVTVRLLTSDSILLSTTKTVNISTYEGNKGAYIFKVKNTGKYIIEATCIGYDTAYTNFEIKSWRQESVFPKNIRIKKKSQLVNEVIITGTKLKMVYSGDTLIYNADAFKVPEGSMLNALVRELPGARIDAKGRIFINGNYVESILLNGKDFFRGDPRIALSHLPAYTVNKIKSYYRENMLNSNQRQLVMDVWLKKEYSHNVIGQNITSAGDYKRFLQKDMFLRFSDISRSMGFLNLNNINDNQTVSYDAEWNSEGTILGKQRTNMGGFLYQYMLDERSYILSENTYTGENNLKESLSNRQNFLGNGSVSTKMVDLYEKNDRTWYSHTTMELANLNMACLNALSLDLELKYKNEKNNKDNTFYTYKSDSTINWRSTNGIGNNEELFLKTKIIASKSFLVDNLIFKTTVNYHKKQTRDFSKVQSFFEATELTDYRHTYHNTYNTELKYETNLSYDYRWPGYVLSPYINYSYSFFKTNNKWYRLDYLGYENNINVDFLPVSSYELDEIMDLNNSYLYDKSTNDATFGIYFRKRGIAENGIQLWLPIRYTHHTLDEHLLKPISLKRKAVFFEPSITLQHETTISQRYKCKLKFSSSLISKIPDLSKMRNYIDDSDPFFHQEGNSNLRNTQIMNISGETKIRDKNNSQSMNVELQYKRTFNAIISSYIFNQDKGVVTYYPENVNGNWQLKSAIGYNGFWGRKKQFSIDNNLQHTLKRSVDIMLYENDLSPLFTRFYDSSVSENLKINYKISSWIQAGIKMNLKWSHATGNEDAFHTINATDYSFGLSSIIDLPFKVQLNTDLTNYSHKGYRIEAMNTNETIWNATASKKMWKGKWLVSAKFYDILGEVSNKYFYIDSQGRTETYVNTISHYFMISMTYNFQIKPQKKQNSTDNNE